MVLEQYQRDFISFAIADGVLSFGEFTLKSGRKSPYFFNAGKFNSGASLAKIGQYYAAAISSRPDIEFDVVFGPAYKDHGEGGSIVGAALKGRRILVVDDVITAGTAIRESMDIIRSAEATLAGVVVAIDRQERGRDSSLSAIQEIERQHGTPVVAVVTLDNVVEYLQEQGGELGAMAGAMEEYRREYGAA
ncbi:hypothetical protein GGI18_002091 [Coemansia linderi]|uniref:Uncharacterized protein n=1 Tax=Coemansia linderi TaxID=2663919 RepID=A0ACC1KHF6_9FUNG|nr:hypothetical protein GGI18_002091 [Coemansia linderi]